VIADRLGTDMLPFSDLARAFSLEQVGGSRFRAPTLNCYGSGSSAATGPIADVIAGGQLLSQAVQSGRTFATLSFSFSQSASR
jgi:hypothetical protein